MLWLVRYLKSLRRMVDAGSIGTRGSAMTEYIVILGTVSIGLAISIVALGPTVVHGYNRARGMILMPYP